MSLPYGNQAELTRYFSGKKPGDQITKAELFGLPSLAGLSIPQRRKVIGYCESTGDLVHGQGGVIFYKHEPAKIQTGISSITLLPSTVSRDHDGISISSNSVARDQPPVAQTDPVLYVARELPKTSQTTSSYPFVSRNDTALTAQVAYQFFDPSGNIFRGVVAEESGVKRDPVKDEYVRRSAGVRVLTPEGPRFGIVSQPHEYADYGYMRVRMYSDRRRDRISESIARRMKEGELVLVRHSGEFTGKSGRPTWLFEPLYEIREDDQATLNGERIATRADGNRILYLPIVEPGKVRSGVLNGVGYIEDFTPVYVDGAGDKVWLILPEVNARKVTKQDDSRLFRSSHAFYIGELPTSPDAKTTRDLARIDSSISYAEFQIRMHDLYQAVNGHSEDDPALQTAYKIALGLFKTAREAGRTSEVAERRDKMRGLLAKAAAIETLQKKEREMISGFYREGTKEYEEFMREWPEMLESYLNTLEARGEFRSSWWSDESASSRRERKRSELSGRVPVDDMLVTGLFNRDVISRLTYGEFREYLDAVNKSFGIASDAVSSSHDWLGDFSINAVLHTAQEIINEQKMSDVIGDSFRGIDIESEWERIAESLKRRNYDLRIGADPSKVDISMRLMRPYFERAKESLMK